MDQCTPINSRSSLYRRCRNYGQRYGLLGSIAERDIEISSHIDIYTVRGEAESSAVDFVVASAKAKVTRLEAYIADNVEDLEEMDLSAFEAEYPSWSWVSQTTINKPARICLEDGACASVFPGPSSSNPHSTNPPITWISELLYGAVEQTTTPKAKSNESTSNGGKNHTLSLASALTAFDMHTVSSPTTLSLAHFFRSTCFVTPSVSALVSPTSITPHTASWATPSSSSCSLRRVDLLRCPQTCCDGSFARQAECFVGEGGW